MVGAGPPHRHLSRARAEREEIYFVTSVPDPTWNVESWSTRGDDGGGAARRFAGFHEDVQRVLRGLPAGAQVGAVRARSAAAVVRRADRLAGRRLPSR